MEPMPNGLICHFKQRNKKQTNKQTNKQQQKTSLVADTAKLTILKTKLVGNMDKDKIQYYVFLIPHCFRNSVSLIRTWCNLLIAMF